MQTSQTTEFALYELTENKDQFQKILSILIDYDDRTGVQYNGNDKISAGLRRMVAECDPSDLKVSFMDMGHSVYGVIALVKTKNATFSTYWLHEDGIYTERLARSDEPDHPVHSTICITDLVQKHSVPRADSDTLSTGAKEQIDNILNVFFE